MNESQNECAKICKLRKNTTVMPLMRFKTCKIE